jgi:hypothetical protein
MNIETEQLVRPKWLLLCLALVSAILAFRISTFVISFGFLVLRRFPFRVIAFFHMWDYAIVPLLSICFAVVVSRWQERILAPRSLTTNYMVLAVVGIMACCPLQLQIQAHPVMCSPLQIAISDNYSQETLEVLVDRYPRLINGTDRNWDHFCPLVEAAYRGKTNLVELLIRKGANVDYAIERLMQTHAEKEIALVLKYSKDHNKMQEDTSRRLTDPQH